MEYQKLAVMSSVVLVGLVFAGITLNRISFSVPPSIKDGVTRHIKFPDKSIPAHADALYILGGPSGSTVKHVETAARLYAADKTSRILFFDSHAKCRYEPGLCRNLTQNEWVTGMLRKRGVDSSAITTVPVKEGFFGTLSEARALAAYCAGKKYLSVILIASPGHTRRVALSFGHYFGRKKIRMYIIPSDDSFRFSETVGEFIKLQVYKMIIASEKIALRE